MTKKRAKSVLTQIVADLGGLEDKHLKFLTFFLREEMKIEFFDLYVDYECAPKVVTIHCFDSNQKEVYVRLKNAELLVLMVKFLGIPLWEFKFAVKKR
jgi:hypothetical protein